MFLSGKCSADLWRMEYIATCRVSSTAHTIPTMLLPFLLSDVRNRRDRPASAVPMEGTNARHLAGDKGGLIRFGGHEMGDFCGLDMQGKTLFVWELLHWCAGSGVEVAEESQKTALVFKAFVLHPRLGIVSKGEAMCDRKPTLETQQRTWKVIPVTMALHD